MTVREIRPEDIPQLEKLAQASGFPYPDLNDPLIEVIQVVVDSQDNPVIAVVARRMVEAYVYVDSERSPVVKMDAMKMAHSSMAAALRDIGYTSIEGFVPPDIEAAFGRRLERTFRWTKNHWRNWTLWL